MSAATVSRVALAVTGRDLRLHESILTQNSSPTGDNIAETFEAVLGAIYLDSGSMLSTVKEVIKRIGLDDHPYLRAHKQPYDGMDTEEAFRVVEQQTRKQGSLKGTAMAKLKDHVKPNKSQLHNVVVTKSKLNLVEPETVVGLGHQSGVTSSLTKEGANESEQPQGIVKDEASEGRSLKNVLTNLYDNVSKLVHPMPEVRRSQGISENAPTAVFVSYASSAMAKPEVKDFSGDMSCGVRRQARYAAMVLTKIKHTQPKKNGIKSNLKTASNNTLLAMRKEHSEKDVKVREEAVTAQTNADEITLGCKLEEIRARTKTDGEETVRTGITEKEINLIMHISQPRQPGGEAQYDKMLVSGKATKSMVNAGNIAAPTSSAQKSSGASAKRGTSAPPPYTSKSTSTTHKPAPSDKSQKNVTSMARSVRASTKKNMSDTSNTTSGNYDTAGSTFLGVLERNLLQSHQSAWSSLKPDKQQRPKIAVVSASKAGLSAVGTKRVGRTVTDGQVWGQLKQLAMEAQTEIEFAESEVDLLMGGILRDQDQAADEFAKSSTSKLEINADSVAQLVKGSERNDASTATQPHKLKPSLEAVNELKKFQLKEIQLASQQHKWTRTVEYIQGQIKSRLDATMIPADSAEVTTVGDDAKFAGTGAAESDESFRTWRQRQQLRVLGNDLTHEAVRANVEVLMSIPIDSQHSSVTLSAVTEQKSIQDGERHEPAPLNTPSARGKSATPSLQRLDSTTETGPKDSPLHVQQSTSEHEGVSDLKSHMPVDAVKSEFGLGLRTKEPEQREETSSAKADESSNSVNLALPTDQFRLRVHKLNPSKQVPLGTSGEEGTTAASNEWDPSKTIRTSLASQSTLVILPPSDAIPPDKQLLSASPEAVQVARAFKVWHADRSEDRPSRPA
jgi:hypothetical protein